MTDLDELLERFQQTALEYGPGLANHGPMTAEAIVALGHSALLTGWLDLYAPRLPPFEPGAPIPGGERDAALGDPARTADWVATFEAELAERDWQAVLRDAVPTLAPGFFASATHGWLRVAHAVRAIEREPTPVRIREIAFGLGLWSARFHPLPGTPGRRPSRSFGAVAAAIEPVPAEHRVPGLFQDAVRALDGDEGFAAVVDSLDLADRRVGDTIGEVCRAGARWYLDNPHARIGYAHVVTATSAIRLVEGILDEATRRALLGRAIQAGCALHAVLGTPGVATGAPSEEIERLAEDRDEIRYRAACSLREHAIKLAEACLREDALAPDPALRLAAADAALALEG